MTAENLAEARRNFAAADAVHQAHLAKVRSIQDRIQVAKAKQSAITNRRVAGTDSPDDAAEFAALGADLELLKEMLTEAQAAASAKAPDHERNLLSQAETLHQREQDAVNYEALLQSCQKLDQALCDCIAQTAAFGRKIGHVSLSQSWRPSDTLHRAISYGVPPGGAV